MNRESERKRLVELIEKQREECKVANCGLCGLAGFGKYPECQNKRLADILLANGVIVPPVKVGDKVYFLYEKKVFNLTIEKLVIKEDGMFLVDKSFNDWYSTKELGETLYLSEAEAEKMLKGEGKSEESISNKKH